MSESLLDRSYVKMTGKAFMISLAIFLLFIFIVLPGEAERSELYFGDSPTPDTSLIYTGDDLYEMAGNFGPEGRAYYIRSRFTFDIIWPLAYGFFLWSGIAYFGRPYRSSTARYLLLLPLTGVILDFLENSGASLVMHLYPERVPVLREAVPIFTFGKWAAIFLSFAAFSLLAILRAVSIIVRMRKNRKTKD